MVGCKSRDISFGRKGAYSFQISVDHVEAMDVLQAIRNVGQLSGTSVGLLRDQVTTYEFDAVYTLVPLDKLVDVPVLHPLGNESKPVFV